MTGSHAGFHLCVNITVLDFRGIALSKTVALTLLIILIRNSQRRLYTYQCLCLSNFIESKSKQ